MLSPAFDCLSCLWRLAYLSCLQLLACLNCVWFLACLSCVSSFWLVWAVAFGLFELSPSFGLFELWLLACLSCVSGFWFVCAVSSFCAGCDEIFVSWGLMMNTEPRYWAGCSCQWNACTQWLLLDTDIVFCSEGCNCDPNLLVVDSVASVVHSCVCNCDLAFGVWLSDLLCFELVLKNFELWFVPRWPYVIDLISKNELPCTWTWIDTLSLIIPL